jgi:hypothetical protein
MGLVDREYMKAERWQREQRQRLAAWQWRRFPRTRRANARGRVAQYVIVAAIACALAIAIGYAAGSRVGPFAAEPLLVWSGEEFNSKAEFEPWLRIRGGSYRAWAAKHPAAAAKLERRP